MKIYLSAWLSSGVVEIMATQPTEDGHVKDLIGGAWYRVGDDAHTIRAEAVAALEAKRVKRIESLRRQIAKLEELKIE